MVGAIHSPKAHTVHAVELVSPVTADWWPRVWGWMQQHPHWNCDDTTPTTVEDFADLMTQRASCEWIWGVTADGQPCGVIAYQPEPDTAQIGMFHGICFDEAVWGTGVAREAVARVLTELFAQGTRTVVAAYFADNARVARFLQRLGAVDDPVLHVTTSRGGRVEQLRVVRFTVERRVTI